MEELDNLVRDLAAEVAKLKDLRAAMDEAEQEYLDQRHKTREAEQRLENAIRARVGTEYSSPADAPRL